MSEEFQPYSSDDDLIGLAISLASQSAPWKEAERRQRILRLNIELVRKRMATMRAAANIERARRTIENLEGQLQL